MSKQRFLGGLLGANPLRAGSFTDGSSSVAFGKWDQTASWSGATFTGDYRVDHGVDYRTSVIDAVLGPTDKVYIEVQTNASTSYFGLCPDGSVPLTNYLGSNSTSWSHQNGDRWYHNGGTTGTRTYFTSNNLTTVLMYAIDRSTGEVWAGHNGTWHRDPLTQTGNLTGVTTTGDMRFGYSNLGTRHSVINTGDNVTFDGNFSTPATIYSDADGNGEFRYPVPTGFKALATITDTTAARTTSNVGILSLDEAGPEANEGTAVAGDAEWSSVVQLFDGSASGSTLTDATGSNNGTLTYNVTATADADDGGTITAQPNGTSLVDFTLGGYVNATAATSFQFGNGAFTIEAWVYITQTPTAGYGDAIIDTRTTASGAGVLLVVNPSMRLDFYSGGAFRSSTSSSTLSLNTWHHIALTRDANSNWTTLVDGTAHSASTYSTNLTQNNCYWGAVFDDGGSGANTNWRFTGYMADMRVTKGVARAIATDWTAGVYSSALPQNAPVAAKQLTPFNWGGIRGRDAVTTGVVSIPTLPTGSDFNISNGTVTGATYNGSGPTGSGYSSYWDTSSGSNYFSWTPSNTSSPTAFTVIVDFEATNTNTYKSLASFDISHPSQRASFHANDAGQISWYDGSVKSFGLPYSANTRYVAIAVYNGTTITGYLVDTAAGTTITSADITAAKGTSQVTPSYTTAWNSTSTIGRFAAWGAEWLSGQVYGGAYWPSALTEAQLVDAVNNIRGNTVAASSSSLDLNFDGQASSFTRATTSPTAAKANGDQLATDIVTQNKSGTVQSKYMGPNGKLINGYVQNHVDHSTDFSQWTVSNATLTSGQDDPFGGTSASTLTDSNNNNTGNAYASVATTPPASVTSKTWSASVWVKKEAAAVNNGLMRLGVSNSTDRFDLQFNAYTGGYQVLNTATSPSSTSSFSADREDFGDWYRFSVSCVLATANYLQSGLYIFPAANTGTFLNSYDSSLTGSITIFGAQLETTATPSQYVPSTASPTSAQVPRVEFDASGNPLGLLVEESRTNIMTATDDVGGSGWTTGNITVTTDYGTAPDGTNTSARFQYTNVGYTTVNKWVTISTTSTDTYTGSVWYKGTGAFRIQLNQQGVASTTSSNYTATAEWQRATVTRTNSNAGGTGNFGLAILNASGSIDMDVEFWGAQVELGDGATSYIPNTATSGTVTRAADDISLATSSFGYNTAANTVLADFTIRESSLSLNGVYRFDDGSNNNNDIIYYDTAAAKLVRQEKEGGTSTVYDMETALSPPFSRIIAARNDGTAARDAIDGTLGSLQTIVAPSTLRTTLYLGRSNIGHMTGHIRRLTYWPRAISDDQLVGYSGNPDFAGEGLKSTGILSLSEMLQASYS